MNRLNQLRRIAQMIQSNKSINSIYFRSFLENLRFRQHFLAFYDSVELIQSYQWLKVNRLNHLLYKNELTQSPISSLTESIQSILQKNESIQINQLNRVDWYTCLPRTKGVKKLHFDT